MEAVDMREVFALDPSLGLGQHLGRHVDAGDVRIGPEMRQRQAGADADLEDALPRPVVGDAHGVLSARMEYRTEDEIVGAGYPPIGADRVAKIHQFVPVAVAPDHARVASQGCPSSSFLSTFVMSRARCT